MSKKKKGIDLDTQKIVSWCKSNLVLVILIVVSIAAIIGLPHIASGFEENVKETLKKRGGYFSKIEKLQNSEVTLPGRGETIEVVINQSLIDKYKSVTGEISGQAKEVLDLAKALNRSDFQVLFAGELFPSPTQSQMETIPQLFYRQLVKKYKGLLTLVNAGSPPERAELVSQLEEERVRFMDSHLSTKQDANLTAEQRESLEKHLSKIRLSILRTQAQDMSVYFEESILNIPVFSLSVIPSVGELFVWQWRYWAVADIVDAIAEINDRQTELTSLIKRVLSIEVIGLPIASPEVPTGDKGKGSPNFPSDPPKKDRGRGPGRGGPLTSGGSNDGGGSGSGSPSTPNSPPTGGIPNSGDTGAVLTHTQRNSNALYDLIQIRVSMIVNSERIPVILDGFASHNFLTVVDLDIRPADKFIALDYGFDYGSSSVSQMTVVFESAWLRSWTTEFMPDSVKKTLGIEIK
jgi:hypothetical protein